MVPPVITSTSGGFLFAHKHIRFNMKNADVTSFFTCRTLFDHMVEQERALPFSRNSILLVENTYPDHVTGQWIASLVDEQGGRSTRGRIPSKIT